MNITKEAWNKYIATIAKLDEKAASMIKDWVNSNGLMNRDALIDYTFNVVQTLSLGSGALAVDWYEAVAQLEGVVIPGAEIAELPTYGDVAKTVNGVMKRSLNADTIASAASMLVKRTAADTTLYNAKRDGAEFAWIPVGDTCPFCMQLASYGWRRASEKTVKGDHAEHIHPNCDCEFAIRFGNDLKYSSYDPDKYKEIYENAEGDTVAEKRNSIRRMQYQENKDRINAQKRAAYAKRNNIQLRIEASNPFKNPNTPLEIYDYDQSKHVVGGKKYNEHMKTHEYPPSYLTISEEEAQKLVDEFHGSGILKLDKNGNVIPVEMIVDNNKVIGYAVNNLNGMQAETTGFKIHYSDKGTHIVPMYPSMTKYWKEVRDNNGHDWRYRQKS